jgi:hypothetical protein
MYNRQQSRTQYTSRYRPIDTDRVLYIAGDIVQADRSAMLPPATPSWVVTNRLGRHVSDWYR